MSDEIRETLNQRGANYGLFTDNACISVELMGVIEAQKGWRNFEPDQKVATWIIIQKLARALSGNAQYDDNWRDIAGYAQLIVDRINGTGTYATTTDGLSHAGLSDDRLRVTETSIAKFSGRCRSCNAKLGDAHKADCPQIR